MRDYGKVTCEFWSIADRDNMSDDGKLLALYLQTCVHSTIAGVFRLPDGYAAEDLRWEPERVREGFRELLSKGFANRCETTKWVWVAKHLEWNRPENPNQLKAVLKVVATVPEQCTWKPDFMRVCGPALGLHGDADRNPCGTLAEPLANQEQEQVQEQEQKHSARRAVGGDPAGFAEFWEAWPKTARKQDRKKCAEKWRRAGFGDRLQAILSHVAAMKLTRDWREGYEPAPLTYLNGERWNDGLPPPTAPSTRRPVLDAEDVFAGAR